jgi:hypothetical protein
MVNVKIIDGLTKEKDWYKSLTIQSAIGIILIVVGFSVHEGQINPESMLILMGCISVLYGRIKAQTEIKK